MTTIYHTNFKRNHNMFWFYANDGKYLESVTTNCNKKDALELFRSQITNYYKMVLNSDFTERTNLISIK